MPKTGKNIYKRKDGRWEARFIKGYENGKAQYKAVYAHSLSEVKKKLKIAKEENAKQRNPVEKFGTIKVVGNLWLKEKSYDLKESTINKYEDLLRCYILPVFGDCEISEITNEQLIRFGHDLLSEGSQKKQRKSVFFLLQNKTV